MKNTRSLDRRSWGYVLILLVLTLLALLIIIPFYNAIVISFETSAAFNRNPLSLYPLEFTLDNYTYLLNNGGLLTAYKSTILITVLGTLWGMSASVMAAYVFSRSEMPGRKMLFLLMLL